MNTSPRLVLVFALGALLFSAAVLFVLLWPIHRIAGQAYALIALLLAFRFSPPVSHWLENMPKEHRLVLALLLGGLIVGHFTLQPYKFFPFVSWEIFPFVREEDPVTCRQFQATTASGKSVRLLAEQLFPSIVQFNPPAENDSPAMTHLVQSLAGMYNRHHPGDPVRRVDLVQVSIPLHSAKFPPCELLNHYEISSAPSN
jgi:hypothetical protein